MARGSLATGFVAKRLWALGIKRLALCKVDAVSEGELEIR